LALRDETHHQVNYADTGMFVDVRWASDGRSEGGQPS